MTNRSPVTTNKHSPSAKYPVELTVRQVQMSNAGTYACLVTNSHGFTFRFIDFPLTSASLVSSFDDTQRWNRFVSLLSGSICIVLAIVTLTLRCFLSIKQQKTKKSINQTDVNKSANVLLNNVSHHLQNPYQLNHLRNPLLVSTNNPIDASSVNCVLPNQSQSKCNFGNYFGTIPNQLPLISPTVN